MDKRGTTTLPLHNGSAPRWLFERMVELSGAMSRVIIDEFGQDELVRRLADPYWFQGFGCALGFDWHSSGLTTTTMGALKEALDFQRDGVMVAGGKGATARRTPDEIDAASINLSRASPTRLKRYSRLSAKIDNACVQDSFTLYHHTMVITEGGEWSVIQQGMGDAVARRYHWLSETVSNPVIEPQNAICSQQIRPSVLDLTARDSEETRQVSLDLVNDDPNHLKQYLNPPGQRTINDFTESVLPTQHPELTMPTHHDLQISEFSERTINQLQIAYEAQPTKFEDLVSLNGIGQQSLRALALVAELIFDAESSHVDPAKYAFAHGGKDGTPFPVDRDQYDRTIDHLQMIIGKTDLAKSAETEALERLTEWNDAAE